jgi:hypothetical protein
MINPRSSASIRIWHAERQADSTYVPTIATLRNIDLPVSRALRSAPGGGFARRSSAAGRYPRRDAGIVHSEAAQPTFSQNNPNNSAGKADTILIPALDLEAVSA